MILNQKKCLKEQFHVRKGNTRWDEFQDEYDSLYIVYTLDM